MNKCLVTGGCGFIGSNFIRHLLRSSPDMQVVNLDALTYAGNLQTLSDVDDNPRYQFVKGDIADAELVGSVFAEHKLEAVVNFAAESHVDRSIEDPQTFLKTNILGTQVLLDACRKSGIDRFVQVSTDEVYGQLGPTGSFTESTPLGPRSPYSASKAGADVLALAYHSTYEFPVIVTRCSNNYGPYQFPEKLIPLVILNAYNNKPVPVYGDGLYIRDWVHVEDHCRAVELALTQGTPGNVYNIGGGTELTNLELVRQILKMVDRSECLITHVEDRKGHDRRYAVDCTKAERELNWKAEVPFTEGLWSTVDWYLSNKQWWQEIVTGQYRDYYDSMYGNRATFQR